MNYKRVLLTIVSVLVLLLSYLEFVKPKLVVKYLTSNKSFINSHYDNNQIRDYCHKVLKYKWNNPYEALLLLQGVGDQSSIPFLLDVLKNCSGEDGLYDHNQVICVDILKRITKQNDRGYDFKDWADLNS